MKDEKSAAPGGNDSGRREDNNNRTFSEPRDDGGNNSPRGDDGVEEVPNNGSSVNSGEVAASGVLELWQEDAPPAVMARKYRDQGLAVVPLRPGSKKHAVKSPKTFEATDEAILKHFGDDRGTSINPICNIGVLMGSRSGGLVDIDCDVPEASALASEFLPETVVFGRPGNPRSHLLYWSPGIKTAQFRDPASDSDAMLVEIRSDKVATTFPGSTHESGEKITFEPGETTVAAIEPEDLWRLVGMVAAASLLARKWVRGVRHLLALCVAGALIRTRWPEGEVRHFVGAVARVAGDEEVESRLEDVASTAERHRQGDPIQGFAALEEHLGRAVATKLKKWLPAPAELGHDVNEEKPDAVERLLKEAKRAELFLSTEGVPHATWLEDGRRNTSPIGLGRSGKPTMFGSFLARQYFRETRRPVAPGTLDTVLYTLQAEASAGPEIEVHHRIAEVDGAIYIDRGDSSRTAIEITRDGYKVVADAPARFRRSPTQGGIPDPIDGDLRELRQFVNLASDDDFILLVAFLLSGLRAGPDHPVLVVNGGQGATKSTLSRVVKALVDPARSAPLRALPRKERDLGVAVYNSFLLAYSNISTLPDWLSDSFCRISSGEGYGIRELYTDRGEITHDDPHPFILNGIEEFAVRNDLIDRAIVLRLPPMPKQCRQDRLRFWKKFEEARPRILGGLLRAASEGLRNLDTVELEELPRMADLARWVVACEPVLPWEPGAFIRAYLGNRDDEAAQSVEASVVARAMRDWAYANYAESPREVTAADLLDELTEQVGPKVEKRKVWPTTPAHLSNALRRVAPALLSVGVQLTFGLRAATRKGERLIRVEVTTDPDGGGGGPGGDGRGGAPTPSATGPANPRAGASAGPPPLTASDAPATSSDAPGVSADVPRTASDADGVGATTASTSDGPLQGPYSDARDTLLTSPREGSSEGSSEEKAPSDGHSWAFEHSADASDAPLQKENKKGVEDVVCNLDVPSEAPTTLLQEGRQKRQHRQQEASPWGSYEYLRDADAARQALQELRASLLLGEFVGIDFETTGLDPLVDRPRLLQLATSGAPAVIVDLFDVPLVDIADLLVDLPLVAHNAMFEMGYLRHHGGIRVTPQCTQLAEHVLSGRRRSLEEVVRDHLGIAIDKSEQRSDWAARSLTPSQLQYAAIDAQVLPPLFDELLGKIDGVGARRSYDLAVGAQPAIVSMVLAGVPFDRDAHGTLVEHLEEKIAGLGEQLAIALPDVNVSSAPQFSKWIGEQLGGPGTSGYGIWPRTNKGALKTGAETLQDHTDLLPESARRIVTDLVLPYRKAKKLLGTFGLPLGQSVHPATGRIHCNLNIGGAPTGRMSASKPNLQQIPKGEEFRRLFAASEGKCLIAADYSQMELRVLAHLSNDANLLRAYADGADFHRDTAASLLGKPADEVTPSERGLAKSISLGLIFGQGPRALCDDARRQLGMDISEGKARAFQSKWFDLYPQAAAWRRARERDLSKYGAVRTLGGRLRRLGSRDVPEAYNTPVQGTAAEILFAAFAHLDQLLQRLDIDAVPILTVHDEILLESSEAHAGDAKAILEKAMVQGMLDLFPDASTNGLIEAKICRNWAEAK